MANYLHQRVARRTGCLTSSQTETFCMTPADGVLYGIVFRPPKLALTLSQDRLSGQDNGLEYVVMRYKSCLLFARLYMKNMLLIWGCCVIPKIGWFASGLIPIVFEGCVSTNPRSGFQLAVSGPNRDDQHFVRSLLPELVLDRVPSRFPAVSVLTLTSARRRCLAA